MQVFFDNFSFDSINFLFASTGVILTFLTWLSAWRYIKVKRKWYYFINIIYLFSFIILIYADDWFLFLISWELVTITTTSMLLWSSRRLALQYFIIQFIGSSFLLYVILVAVSKGYSQIGAVNEIWLQNMFIFGLGMKSAVFGLHFWLPPIHSMAPAPVSAILSGWVVKLGFITYLKIIPDGNILLLLLGLLMVFYSGIKALLATDYKVLLAYSTISQLGYIAIGIGSGTFYGYLGSIFHVVAHGLAKTTLFLGSGYWLKDYGTRLVYNFYSAWERQRLNSISTLISFSSLMGLPFFVGYNSKYLIKYGVKGGILLSLLMHGASIITILYSIRFLRWSLFKDEITLNNKIRNGKKFKGNYRLSGTDKLSLIPPSVLLIVLGMFPSVLTVSVGYHYVDYHLLSGFQNSVIYLVVGILILKKLNWLKVKRRKQPSLDNLFRGTYEFFNSLSSKSFKFDTESFFEGFLYQRIFNFSRGLYNMVYKDFQKQLLWIPFVLSLLLLWIILYTKL